MRTDVWILFFLCASVFAKPTQDDDFLYSIEIVRNGSSKVYHDKLVEINYSVSETIDITFIQSGADEELPFMKLYWIKGNERIEKDEIKHNFRRQIKLMLTSAENDCRLQCEIWFRGRNTQTLEVHFMKILDPSENIIQKTGNLFKIILIALGAFIVISILVMILVAVYKHFKNKSTSGYNTTTYPEYSEIIPMNKINNKPKNVDDNTTGSEGGVVNNKDCEHSVMKQDSCLNRNDIASA